MFKYLSRVGVLLLLILFVACTPQQRLQRLLKKHPELIAKEQIIKVDTIIIPSFKFDTIFKITTKSDTFYIDKERLRIQIIKKDSNIYVNSFISSDTIIKFDTIYSNQIKYITEKENYNKFYWFAAGFLLLLLILFFVKKVT